MNWARQEHSRRRFLTTATGAGTAMLLHLVWSWAVERAEYGIDPRVAAIKNRTLHPTKGIYPVVVRLSTSGSITYFSCFKPLPELSPTSS